jgi:hypothetical protein
MDPIITKFRPQKPLAIIHSSVIVQIHRTVSISQALEDLVECLDLFRRPAFTTNERFAHSIVPMFVKDTFQSNRAGGSFSIGNSLFLQAERLFFSPAPFAIVPLCVKFAKNIAPS